MAALVAAGFVLLILIVRWMEPSPVPPVLGASERSIALSENGRLLAVGTLDGKLRLVGAETGHVLVTTQLHSPIVAVSFGPNETVLALAQRESILYIFSSDLATHTERVVQSHAVDVVWSSTLDAAVVISGGNDNIHPTLEFFPAHPLGIANSTSQSFDLREWSNPVNLAISADGSRAAIALSAGRRANVIFYDPLTLRVAATSSVTGQPKGVAIAADGTRAWVVSPAAEAITEITARTSMKTEFPKSASTSPLQMVAVNEQARRAYTTGALTFPEVDLDRRIISRTLELPNRSSAIAISRDGATAYLTFQDVNKVGVLNLRDMQTFREISLP